MKYVRRWFLVAAAATIASSGCSSKSTEGDGPAGKVVIKLAHNSWLSAELNDAIAKKLLEDKLGYSVELTKAGTVDQWPKVATGELHASLEVWPGGHAERIQKYVNEEHSVEDAGLLGPLAKVGWFIPTYLLSQHPELATWEGFQKSENALLFRTPDSGDKGRFLAGDPSWVQIDQQVIDNLKMDLKVVYAGSEDAQLAELESAYARRAPILFYFWTPHWALAKYDLTIVRLPTYTPECWAKKDQNGANCDYPTDRLFKIFWSGFKAKAPEAYRFLRAMSFSTQTQIELMSQVKIQGKSVEDAASDWIGKNESVWKPWITAP